MEYWVGKHELIGENSLTNTQQKAKIRKEKNEENEETHHHRSNDADLQVRGMVDWIQRR
jgi:hypothetical protein